MPKLYIIKSGINPPEIKLEFNNNNPLIFGAKNGEAYSLIDSISKHTDGFRQREITIPKKLYTQSLNPTGENRILQITKDNSKEFEEFVKKYPDTKKYKELSKRNIIGLDKTNKKKEHSIGHLWEFPDIIKFGKTKIIYLKKIKYKKKIKPKIKPTPKLELKSNQKLKLKKKSNPKLKLGSTQKMSTYYIIDSFVERGELKINIRKGKIIDSYGRKGVITFYKKTSKRYKVLLGKLFGTFLQREINIPTYLFTTSLNPTDKNRILKITVDNIEEFEKLEENFKDTMPDGKRFLNFQKLQKELNNRHFIGIDQTIRKEFDGFNSFGCIWRYIDEIKIGKTETIVSKSKSKSKNK
jgi:hypothetical protein